MIYNIHPRSLSIAGFHTLQAMSPEDFDHAFDHCDRSSSYSRASNFEASACVQVLGEYLKIHLWASFAIIL